MALESVVSTMTFPELYELFDSGQLDAIAEAEYFTLDGRVIPSHGSDIVLIDHWDFPRCPLDHGEKCLTRSGMPTSLFR